MAKQNRRQEINVAGRLRTDQTAIREEIRRLAYQLFCEGGRKHGHDQAHWLEAERRLLERAKAGTAAPY